ncbi:MAG: hypothetical protein IVW51_15985 [Thermaceae bacterium]|nr:hypothetical protein [Thermaceae bacterium]
MENVPKDIQRNERTLRELSSEFHAVREKLEGNDWNWSSVLPEPENSRKVWRKSLS